MNTKQIPGGILCHAAVSAAKSMFGQALITEDEYAEADTAPLEKYLQYSGAFMSESA